MTALKEETALGLSGNQLKLIALFAMTCDHVAVVFFPHMYFLRIIGRLAFPIFAYMIAEGCLYTKNKKKHLLSMAALALVCQLVYFFFMGSLYQCVLVTFTLSIGLIYLLDYAFRKEKGLYCLPVLLGFVAAYFLCEVLPDLLIGTDYQIDYGIWGVMLPLLVYFGKNAKQKLLYFACDLVLLSFRLGGIQWYALAAVALLALYNGKRGKYRMKYLFYIYYPAHLALIQLIRMLL